jgi:hypothetical protein
MTVRKTLALPLMLLMALAGPAFADNQHVGDPTALSATVTQRVAQRDADRAAISDALARPEVAAVAARMGLNLDHVTASLDALTGSDLARAGDAARQVNQQLVGGASTITMSTTTIILVLLLVILLIIAVK